MPKKWIPQSLEERIRELEGKGMEKLLEEFVREVMEAKRGRNEAESKA